MRRNNLRRNCLTRSTYYSIAMAFWVSTQALFIASHVWFISYVTLSHSGPDRMIANFQTFSNALNENAQASITISLKFVPNCPVKNILTLVQIIPRRRPVDKSLSDLMMGSLLMHICVTRSQWVSTQTTPQLLSNLHPCRQAAIKKTALWRHRWVRVNHGDVILLICFL